MFCRFSGLNSRAFPPFGYKELRSTRLLRCLPLHNWHNLDPMGTRGTVLRRTCLQFVFYFFLVFGGKWRLVTLQINTRWIPYHAPIITANKGPQPNTRWILYHAEILRARQGPDSSGISVPAPGSTFSGHKSQNAQTIISRCDLHSCQLC